MKRPLLNPGERKLLKWHRKGYLTLSGDKLELRIAVKVFCREVFRIFEPKHK